VFPLILQNLRVVEKVRVTQKTPELQEKKILVLGLGNEIMGDDAVGIIASRELRAQWEPGIDVVETPNAGFALLDFLEGYDLVLIIDSVATGTCAPGTIRELSLQDFVQTPALSPHVVGLPEIVDVARRLDIAFPSTIRILTLEVEDPYVIREGLSVGIAPRLRELVRAAEEILMSWCVRRKECLSYHNNAS